MSFTKEQTQHKKQTIKLKKRIKKMKSDKLINVWVNYLAYAQSKGFDILEHVGVGKTKYALLFGENEIKIDYRKKSVRFKPDNQWIPMNDDMLKLPKSLVQWGALVFTNDGTKTDSDGNELAEIEVLIGTGSPFSYLVDGKDQGLPVIDGYLIVAPAKAMIKG